MRLTHGHIYSPLKFKAGEDHGIGGSRALGPVPGIKSYINTCRRALQLQTTCEVVVYALYRSQSEFRIQIMLRRTAMCNLLLECQAILVSMYLGQVNCALRRGHLTAS